MDTDQDGMPDAWEQAHDLGPDNADDRNGTQVSPEGYTDLEVYLNELAAGGTATPIVENERGIIKDGYTGNTISSRFTGGALILNAPEKMHVAITLVDAAGRLFRSWSNVTIIKGGTVFPLRENGRMPFTHGIVIVCIENEDSENRMVINKGE